MCLRKGVRPAHQYRSGRPFSATIAQIAGENARAQQTRESDPAVAFTVTSDTTPRALTFRRRSPKEQHLVTSLRRFTQQAALVSAIVLAMTGGAAAQPPADAPPAIVLVTTYADGRAVHDIVTARRSTAWTPMFPRVASWKQPDGTLPVTAINYARVLVDGAITVTISVLRGAQHQKEDAVATVTIKPGERRVVSELRDFGAQPVTLSLMPLAASTLYPPKVANKTAGLEVSDIEVITEPAPQYRVHVKNVSAKTALTFHFQTYRDGHRGAQGHQGNRDGQPLIAPGGIHTFVLRASRASQPTAAGWAPVSEDLFEIDSVLWDDGTFEGDGEPVASTLMLAMGRRVQLARVIPLLQTSAASYRDRKATIDRLRAQFEQLTLAADAEILAAARMRLKGVVDAPQQALAVIPFGMQEVKAGVLSDLRHAPSDPVMFQRWLSDIAALYQVWHDRFAAR
jgi:hypothetical protein